MVSTEWLSMLPLLLLSFVMTTTETWAGRTPSHVRRLPDIYWNTSNPIFRIDNTNHIFDVNVGHRHMFEYDQVNIICPFYSTEPTEGSPMERFVIYVVNKEEYDTCRIMDQHPRVIARCTTPRKLQFITISFRSFTPIPGALEYRPGQDYYFISTSSKTDLHQRVGGMCHDNNMKLIVKVADPNAPTTTITTTTTTKAPPSPPPLIRDQETDDATKSLSEQKQRRRKKWRRRRKERNNSSKSRNNEDLNTDEVLNDKPVKVAEKQPSFVEKVKNYMKQEASITSASATSGQALMRRLDLSVLLSMSFPLAWVIC